MTNGEVVTTGDAATQLVPPFVLYSKLVMGWPPFELGALKLTVKFPPAVMEEMVIAEGVVYDAAP